ncbi:MAG: acyl-CoA thioesterase [Coxiella sp. RIFCSPHIGHO2_12_FULL_42_15]|nr:MAG: acyl-CoA thioesterase [Coxiella sp. RIFCSPHIGHO2_12_FULL_42_15]
MTPEKANFAGNIHGGYLLSLLDKVAYACAARYSGHYVVTLSVDGVIFKEPIHVGELVICLACVNYVGHTSMEIGIKVIAENLRTHQQRHTNSCFFTLIAVDTNLRPTAVKPLVLHNTTQKRRFEEAKLRKEMRLKFEVEHNKRKSELKIEPSFSKDQHE